MDIVVDPPGPGSAWRRSLCWIPLNVSLVSLSPSQRFSAQWGPQPSEDGGQKYWRRTNKVKGRRTKQGGYCPAPGEQDRSGRSLFERRDKLYLFGVLPPPASVLLHQTAKPEECTVLESRGGPGSWTFHCPEAASCCWAASSPRRVASGRKWRGC